MPEEKVKQYECLCPCEHKTGCIACENGNHDYHIVPPAADAGPRQPHAIVIHKIPHCVCGHAHDAGNICSRCACRVAKLCNCALAAAPVSQEAAPHSKKCAEQLYSSMDAKCICGSDTVQATALDSAMRVAREKAFTIRWHSSPARYTVSIPCYDGEAVPLEDVAALIREAGSERALRRYADHDPSCPEFKQKANRHNRGLVEDSAWPCNCGLAEILNDV